jgi:hypothetical protein
VLRIMVCRTLPSGGGRESTWIVTQKRTVREDKVKGLRLQIQKNLYRPDPDEIADRMIEESLQEILWLRQNLN